MRFVSFQIGDIQSFGLQSELGIVDLARRLRIPSLRALLEFGRTAEAQSFAADEPDYKVGDVRFLPVIPDPHHIYCIGTNYLDHLQEVQKTGIARPFPKNPSMFIRYPETLVGHGEALIRPKVSTDFDYEAELAVIIGVGGRYIDEARALNHVAGYACFNDGSIRDWQFHTSQVTPGKNFLATGSFGPAMVSADEITDPDQLAISLRLNGETLQQSNTRELIFKIPALIAYASALLPLKPGDVIATGTPAGVGFSRKPPVFMKPGDICEIEIERVGVLCNPVAGAV